MIGARIHGESEEHTHEGPHSDPIPSWRRGKLGRAHSSVGQSCRLITGWSQVRVLVGPSSLAERSAGPDAQGRAARSVDVGWVDVKKEAA